MALSFTDLKVFTSKHNLQFWSNDPIQLFSRMLQVCSNTINMTQNTQNELQRAESSDVTRDRQGTATPQVEGRISWVASVQTPRQHLALLCWSLSGLDVSSHPQHLLSHGTAWHPPSLTFHLTFCAKITIFVCFHACSWSLSHVSRQMWNFDTETIHHQFTVITGRPLVGHLSQPGDWSPSILPKWQLYSLLPGPSPIGQWDGASLCLNRG